MKEYKVGEVFTTDEGQTLRCVRSNGLCSGCVFLTKITDKPRCKAMDLDCSECSREDGQHVIFEEIEEFKYKTEYPVGKVLALAGSLVEVVKDGMYGSRCQECVFHDAYCGNILCMSYERSDDAYVAFKKIEDVTEE